MVTIYFLSTGRQARVSVMSWLSHYSLTGEFGLIKV
jgi:hypothetical protein